MSKSETLQVVDIPLVEIHADESFNCRGKIAPIDVITLAKDIERQGLIQPVVVTLYNEDKQKETGFKYRLIAGFRRYTAFKLVLQRDKIPTIIREDMVDDVNARILNLVENLQRENLNILQEAKALKNLKDVGVGEYDAAERLGKSRGWVQIRYMLLNLPEAVQKEAALGNITQQNIREVYTILSQKGSDAAYKAIKEIKEAKAKGRTNFSVNPNKHKQTIKRQRTRAEIFSMMEHIQDSAIGNGIWTRCLAWAAGEITGVDLFSSLIEYAEKNNLSYTKPSIDE
jgi:ParB family chromosome partitioning protein